MMMSKKVFEVPDGMVVVVVTMPKTRAEGIVDAIVDIVGPEGEEHAEDHWHIAQAIVSLAQAQAEMTESLYRPSKPTTVRKPS